MAIAGDHLRRARIRLESQPFAGDTLDFGIDLRVRPHRSRQLSHAIRLERLRNAFPRAVEFERPTGELPAERRGFCVDAVRAWRAAGENRGMCRQRHRRVRVRVGVTDTRRGKAIERRCEASAIAVRAEPIAAERVNCYQQHVATAQVAGLQ